MAIIAVLLLVGCAQKIDVNQQTPITNTTAAEDISGIDADIANIDNMTNDLNTSDLDNLSNDIDQIKIE